MTDIDLTNLGSFLVFNTDHPLQFPGLPFFFIFCVFMVGFVLLRRSRIGKITFATAFSLYFYYLTDGWTVVALISSVLVNYVFSQYSTRARSVTPRKALLAASVMINLGFLLTVKYSNFFITQVNAVSSGSLEHINLFIPLGLSFYTFQAISYQVDIYRQKAEPLRNLIDFSFYLCFFPKLLAGPLTRLENFGPQILGTSPVTRDAVDRGLCYIIAGLIKKMIIADYIGINFVDRVFANPMQFSGIENLAAVYAYALQIYCDFSGYTDIALGIALFMGYSLPPNFNSPYLAVDIRDFWQRWHISLSQWFRDYLYIPLGGSRHGKIRLYLNYMIVMGLCGFWHGASWNFVIWGLLHGCGLIASSFLPRKTVGFKRVVLTVTTFHFVCFAWIFFRAETFGIAIDVLNQIGTALTAVSPAEFFAAYKYIVALMAAGYLLHVLPITVKNLPLHFVSRMPLPIQALCLAATIWLVMQVKTSDIAPFIYLQF